MADLDWRGPFYHSAVSIAASVALLWAGMTGDAVLSLSLGAWLGREIGQKDAIWKAFLRPQPLLEWTTPVAVTAGAIAAWRLL